MRFRNQLEMPPLTKIYGKMLQSTAAENIGDVGEKKILEILKTGSAPWGKSFAQKRVLRLKASRFDI